MNPDTTLLIGQLTMTATAFLAIALLTFLGAVLTLYSVTRIYEQLLAIYGLRRVEQALAKEDGDPDPHSDVDA